MMKGRDIVVVGLQPWDIEIGSNCKNIALEFSKYNRVLYVNSPIDINTLIKKYNDPNIKKRLKIRKAGNTVIQVAPNIWTLYPSSIIYSINWLPYTSLFNVFNRINNKKIANNIRASLRKLSFTNFVLFNDSDIFRSFYLTDLFTPSLSIYYSRDNLLTNKYWHKHGRKLEPKLMGKVDLVVSNSEYLATMARQYNLNSFNVGQGCNISIFDPRKAYPLPDDLVDIVSIKKPIIGYIGAILNDRLNLELLVSLCKQKKEWNFVFIGNEDDFFRSSELHNFKNVFFLGPKEENMLPFYLSHFDVAMNPQRINEMTIGNYPRKIDEYLAMGKAVVATETITMKAFKDYVYLGKSVGDYINLLEKALLENDKELSEKRIQFAKTHTWENSVGAIYEAIIKVKPELAENETLVSHIASEYSI